MDTCYGASMIDDLVLVCACCFTYVVLHPAASSTCCNAVCTHSGVTLVAMLSSNSCHRLCASVCAACLLSQSATFACCMQLLSCCSAHCWHVVSRAAGALVWSANGAVSIVGVTKRLSCSHCEQYERSRVTATSLRWCNWPRLLLPCVQSAVIGMFRPLSMSRDRQGFRPPVPRLGCPACSQPLAGESSCFRATSRLFGVCAGFGCDLGHAYVLDACCQIATIVGLQL